MLADVNCAVCLKALSSLIFKVRESTIATSMRSANSSIQVQATARQNISEQLSYNESGS